jgi:collagenase-like PrtC family protease
MSDKDQVIIGIPKKNNSPTIELMAPAGSYESMMAAIKAGCNSVYFGVEQLNMRARSTNNFTLSRFR